MRIQRVHFAIVRTAITLLVAVLIAGSIGSAPNHPAGIQPLSVRAQSATPQQFGPNAFGVLPTVRPNDGNDLAFPSQPSGPPNSFNPIINLSLPHASITYSFDTAPAVPTSALVYRLDTAPVSEQRVQDMATSLGMSGALQIHRDGDAPDYSITATTSDHSATLSLSTRGNLSYYVSDPGRVCGAMPATAVPFVNPVVPPTATPDNRALCQNRGTAPDESHAIVVARDLLTKLGFTPPAYYPVSAPYDTTAPTIRTVRFAAVAPGGERIIANRGTYTGVDVGVGPGDRILSINAATAAPDAASPYNLRTASDVIAKLQAGDAYAQLALPQDDATGRPITFNGNNPITVHVQQTTLGYAPVYTFDVRPYLLPALILEGTAMTTESMAVGKEIRFTAWVDAIVHPPAAAVPVMAPSPLPPTPDPSALAPLGYTPTMLTEGDLQSLARALGYQDVMVETRPIGGPAPLLLVTLSDGADLSNNPGGGGGWTLENVPTGDAAGSPPPSADATLADAKAFVSAHHLPLDNLGEPSVHSSPVQNAPYTVCYPLFVNGLPVVRSDGSPVCGLSYTIISWLNMMPPRPSTATLAADPLLIDYQRDGANTFSNMPIPVKTAIGVQEALNALANGAPGNIIPPYTGPEVPAQDPHLVIDDAANAIHRRGGNASISVSWAQLAPNRFQIDTVTLAYLQTTVPGNTVGMQTLQFQPIWFVSGQLDSGDHHRIAQFIDLYPAFR